jgi:hypothetical protein
MSALKITSCALMLSVSCAFGALAQNTFADKAVSRLVGSWVSPQQGRVISFMIRDGNPVFQDEVEPSVTLTGAYRQDDAGAGYVLRYTRGFECRYDVNVVGSEGDEISLRLVSSYNGQDNRFRCIQGVLKRTRAR